MATRSGASEIRAEMHRLLDGRRDGATICPSDVARSIGGENWRELMEQVREVAAEQVEAGELQVTRGGAKVDPRAPGGPIRIGRPGAG